MTTVVAASTQLSCQLAKLTVARSKTRDTSRQYPFKRIISHFGNPVLNDRTTERQTK